MQVGRKIVLLPWPVSYLTGHEAEQNLRIFEFVLCILKFITKFLEKFLLPKQIISNICFCALSPFFKYMFHCSNEFKKVQIIDKGFYKMFSKRVWIQLTILAIPLMKEWNCNHSKKRYRINLVCVCVGVMRTKGKKILIHRGQFNI